MPSLFALMLRAQRAGSATPQPWKPWDDQQGLSSAPVQQNFANPKGHLRGYSLSKEAQSSQSCRRFYWGLLLWLLPAHKDVFQDSPAQHMKMPVANLPGDWCPRSSCAPLSNQLAEEQEGFQHPYFLSLAVRAQPSWWHPGWVTEERRILTELWAGRHSGRSPALVHAAGQVTVQEESWAVITTFPGEQIGGKSWKGLFSCCNKGSQGGKGWESLH